MTYRNSSSKRQFPAEKITRALGWFSIGIGLAELLFPRKVGRSVGMDGRREFVQACGMRELATGVGVLMSPRPAPFLWGRVVGDALDMAALGARVGRGGQGGGNAMLALVGVAAVAALDVAAARAQSAPSPRRSGPLPDYSTRSGFPRGVAEMRGIARDVNGKRPAASGSATGTAAG